MTNKNPYPVKPDLSHRPDLTLTRRLATEAMHYEIIYLNWEQEYQLKRNHDAQR